jgi:hypothetical protein
VINQQWQDQFKSLCPKRWHIASTIDDDADVVDLYLIYLQGIKKKKEPIYQNPSQIAILLHNFICAKFVYRIISF